MRARPTPAATAKEEQQQKKKTKKKNKKKKTRAWHLPESTAKVATIVLWNIHCC
jgi:hypothetical protein